MGNDIPNFWKTRAIWALVLIGLATLWMGWRVAQIGYNYDFESFFPQDDPETEFYLNFRSHFESDNDFSIVGVEHDPAYDPVFLTDVDGYVDELESLPYIEEVLSPTRLKEPVKLGLTIVQRPLLVAKMSTDEVAGRFAHRRTPHVGRLVCLYGRGALAIQSATSNSCPKPDAIASPTPLRRSPPPGNTPYIAGRAVAQKYYVDVMQREVALFVSIGLVILVVFLWVAFQSI